MHVKWNGRELKYSIQMTPASVFTEGGEGNGFATCVVLSITIDDLLVSLTDADDASVCLLTGLVRLWLTSPMSLGIGFASRLVRNHSAQV